MKISEINSTQSHAVYLCLFYLTLYTCIQILKFSTFEKSLHSKFKMVSLNTLKIHPVNLARDWDPLFRTFWRSWSIPRQAGIIVTFPHIGQGGPKEVESFEVKKSQYLAAAKSSPGQLWYKVIDEGQSLFPIVGGICVTHWKEEQRPKHMPDESHEAFEPGSQIQKVSEQFYGQLHEWHTQLMRPREHICKSPHPTAAFTINPLGQCTDFLGL